MKSGKQRKLELKANRTAKRDASRLARKKTAVAMQLAARRRGVHVDPAALAPADSSSDPEFVERGFYVDIPFECQECGNDQIWTASQQKWWYEVAKGGRWTIARLCRECRRKDRTRRNESRRVHLEGAARKAAQCQANRTG